MDKNFERPDMLMARIERAQAADGFKQMNSFNIHPKQIPILLALNENEGISQRELAEKLRVKPPTITVSVKRLSAAGFIIKKEDGKDARISRLYLTEKAKTALESTKNTVNESAEKMFRGFTEEEKAQFSAFLMRILDNLGPIEDCGICSGHGKTENKPGKENT